MLSNELTYGAATVTNLAAHFSMLKNRVIALRNSMHVSQRGFFTPSEDEQTRHLLVSYVQSRNALIELVSSFHDASRFDTEQRPLVLAIAYAGALVLVDGARFLRDSFHGSQIVRRKLNEPEPHFGIPQGTYDSIQQSLTNPRHAWHLYHASRFIEQNWSELESLADTMPSLHDVLKIIQEMQDRLQVSAGRFVAARVRSRGRALRNQLGRDLLRRGLYGLQKSVSQLMSERYLKSGHQPGLPDGIEAELEARLKPGDVIITRKEHALTNYFLPGYWPHAALYIGSIDELRQMELDQHENVKPHWNSLVACDGQRPSRVLEALKDGVRVRSLSCPFASDAVSIVRPKLSQELIARAIGRGCFHTNKPYDFDFDFTRSDRMVCTEVVYRSYESVGGLEFQLTQRAGRLTLSAEDLLARAILGNGFEVHAVYSPSHSNEVCLGDEAARTVRASVGVTSRK